MKTWVIRSEKGRQEYIEYLKTLRLPFRAMDQIIYPGRTIDENAYLWGVVYQRIAEFTGHSTIEVHNGYKEKFRLEYSPDKNGVWRLRVKSTTEDNIFSIMKYALMVRADAELELGITIEMPNECFVNELKFENEI